MAKCGSFDLLGSSYFTGTGTTKPPRFGELGELKKKKHKFYLLGHDLIVVLAKNFVKRTLSMHNFATVTSTGRQLHPVSSVLYRIISTRRYVLAAQLLLREKSGA